MMHRRKKNPRKQISVLCKTEFITKSYWNKHRGFLYLSVDFHSKTKRSLIIWVPKEWIFTPAHLDSILRCISLLTISSQHKQKPRPKRNIQSRQSNEIYLHWPAIRGISQNYSTWSQNHAITLKICTFLQVTRMILNRSANSLSNRCL